MVESARLGCYGMVSAISFNSATCRECPDQSGCLSAASAMLQSFPERPEITRERRVFAVTQRAFASMPRAAGQGRAGAVVVASTRGHCRIRLTDTQLDNLARLPKKVADQVRVLMEKGWFDFAKSELRHGRNPADKGWKKVLCEKLLAGSCTRAELELCLVEQLKLTPASAKVQLSVGLSVFAEGRIATEFLGRVQLQPN